MFRPFKVSESVILNVEIRILHLSFLRFSIAKSFLVLVGTAIILCHDKRYLCFYLLEAIQSVVIAVSISKLSYHVTLPSVPYPTLPFSITPSPLSLLLPFPSPSLLLPYPILPFPSPSLPLSFPSPSLPFLSLSDSRPHKNLRNSIYLTYLMQ